MTRVFGWQTAADGVSHFRLHLPFSALDPGRFDTAIGAPGPDIHDWDVVVAMRVAGDSPLWLDLCADPNVLAVYDIDDDLLNVDPANSVPYAIYAPLVDGTRRNIAAADVVTVPTEAFADRYRAINPNVVVLPTCIPDDMPDWPDQRDPNRFTVGWAGSMFKQQDWPGLAEALAEFVTYAPEVDFHMIGADYTGGRLGGRCRFTGWGTVSSYYRALDFSVGLAPLAWTRFNRTKTRTKAIEYGARGIPTVGTPIGEQATWIEPGVSGLHAATPDEFVEALLVLRDPDLRRSFGEAARDKARTATIGRNIHLWEAVFERNPLS